MKIRKGVVTAAGWGTRFLPATKAQPKEMLPLVDKPLIQYIVEEAVASGIEQIIIVTAWGKRAIEDHFDRSFELEYALEQKGNTELLTQVQRVSTLADVSYIRQKQPLGLGHAVLVTKDLVGNEPFALFLPDDIIDAPGPCMQQMLRVYERQRCSVVAVERVPREKTASYGMIKPNRIADRIYQVLNMVEKPLPEAAPSDLGIVGRYILTPEIFDILATIEADHRGEIQLTDGLRRLLSLQTICAYEFEGTRYDAGTPMGLIKASVEMALRRPDTGDELRAYLRGLNICQGSAAVSSAP
ncbi:MAG: UTP--glucose-1-phosphate uridylyltransferase GalU [Chloroflexi bacterium]|nr:UTP--glucose-1-phosphate uridylyltransferase GalU [Chloroflexota bacterium]